MRTVPTTQTSVLSVLVTPGATLTRLPRILYNGILGGSGEAPPFPYRQHRYY